MNSERRLCRSETRHEACRLYLASVAARTNARSLVVADSDGLLISGVGRDDLDEVAALGMAGSFGAPVYETPLGELGLRLVAVDGAAPPAAEAMAAVARILM